MITPFSPDPSDAIPEPPYSEEEPALDKQKKKKSSDSSAKPKKVSDEKLHGMMQAARLEMERDRNLKWAQDIYNKMIDSEDLLAACELAVQHK